MIRNLMLKMAANEQLVKILAWLGRRSGLARRFVAGDNLEETTRVVEALNQRGILATLDLLGEGVSRQAEAEVAAAAYCDLLSGIAKSNIESSISIKLTQLGLGIDRNLCARNLQRILDRARELGNFVRIDMEGSAYTEATLRLFRDCLAEYGPRHVGVVIQSYLYRSEADVRDLSARGCNVRLCKGAYMEPPSIAFPAKKDVDRNYLKLAEILLGSPAFSAIATHDEKIIRKVRSLAADRKIPEGKYEFQMLYGVRKELQFRLRRQGYRMRIYVPFGTQWAPYFIRRLAERPANLIFVLKHLFR